MERSVPRFMYDSKAQEITAYLLKYGKKFRPRKGRNKGAKMKDAERNFKYWVQIMDQKS